MFCDDGDVAVGFVGGVDEFPFHVGCVGGDAAIDIAVEIFKYFGAALLVPVVGGLDWFSIFEDEGIGQGGVWAGFGFVIVGEMVGGVGGAIGGGTDFGDVEEIHEALVVLVGGEVGGRGCGRGLWGLGRERE